MTKQPLRLSAEVFNPLWRSSIGFDRIVEEFIHDPLFSGAQTSYPPYNIRKIDDLKYSIELALAGFDKKNIDIIYADNSLTIKSKKQDEESKGFMHKGISQRAFTRNFCLAEDVIVNDFSLTSIIAPV